MNATVVYLHRCEVIVSPSVDGFKEKRCQALAIQTIDGHCFVCPVHIKEFVQAGLIQRTRRGKWVTR